MSYLNLRKKQNFVLSCFYLFISIKSIHKTLKRYSAGNYSSLILFNNQILKFYAFLNALSKKVIYSMVPFRCIHIRAHLRGTGIPQTCDSQVLLNMYVQTGKMQRKYRYCAFVFSSIFIVHR